MTRLETERLLLRPLEMSDLAAVSRSTETPACAGTSATDVPSPLTRAPGGLTTHVNGWRELGYGFSAVELRGCSRFVGWLRLNQVRDHPDLDGEIEIGGSIDPDLWRGGLAAEGARAVLGHAFTGLGLPRVVAHYRNDNTASAALLQRLGMRVWKTVPYLDLPGHVTVVCQMRSPTWHESSHGPGGASPG